ncbi:MAG: hypothetical protein HY241_03815 [Actinobacteria bacterium]|nr:hypothetical protein [Actinomycetota bacterium]
MVPSASIAPFVESIAPAGYGPLPGDVEHVLPFTVTWTGSMTCAEKDQVFTGSLDVVADGVVVAHKRVRIRVPACRWHHAVEMVCGLEPSGPEREKCQTVVDGRYATAVTIYNPTNCTVRIEKRFVPLVVGDRVVREPKVGKPRKLPAVDLAPGEATMDDCCSLRDADLPTGGTLLLGVLDIIADQPLEVTAIHTSTGPSRGSGSGSGRGESESEHGAQRVTGTAIHTRPVKPRRE